MSLIVNSRICNMLVENPYLQKLLIIIDNENFPLEIQILALEGLK